MPSSIFIVDSSPAVRRMVEQISAPEGFDVVGFQDGPAALEAARKISPALIIADYHLDNMTFSGFCKEIHKLDNLADTYLISLINPADCPDENHLRSLGVKAFLNKPFQSDDLLDLIKSIQEKHQSASSGAGLKRRVWPPTSTATDSDVDDGDMDQPAFPDEREDHAMDQHSDAYDPALTARRAAAGPEDAMKSLFDQLATSMTERTEKRLGDLLPHAIESKLAAQLQPLVHNEVRAQLGDILSHEQLTAIIQPILLQELPSLLRNELASCEPVIRQTVSELATTSMRDMLEQSVREHSEGAVRKHLPEVVREHLGAIDLVVKDEIRQAVLKQAPLVADEIVRATAEQSVEEAVRRIVPDLAETHITAELTRLTAPEEPPASSGS